MTAPINPDCQQGKHQACSETAWDEEADQLVPCGCTHHRTTTTGRVRPEPSDETTVTGL